jgi:hypothetical protein
MAIAIIMMNNEDTAHYAEIIKREFMKRRMWRTPQTIADDPPYGIE